jgi:hypothetical protein
MACYDPRSRNTGTQASGFKSQGWRRSLDNASADAPRSLTGQNYSDRSFLRPGLIIVFCTSGPSHLCCVAHRLLSAAMVLCLFALGAESALASSSGSIKSGHARAVDGHSCLCKGCRGAETCCCSGAHGPTKPTPVLPVNGSATLASAPCVSPVPCGDAAIPVAGSRTHVSATAIADGLHRPNALSGRGLLVPSSTVSLPSRFVSRLEDPPESSLSHCIPLA